MAAGIETPLVQWHIMSNQYQHLTEDFLSKFKSRDLLPLSCAGCDRAIMKSKNSVLTNMKHSRKTFCTLSCSAKSQQQALGGATHNVNCANCGQATTKSSKDVQKCNNLFCSRRCAAIHNNRLRPREKHTALCGICGEPTTKAPSALKYSKSGKVFCSKKCSAKWAASFLKREPRPCVRCSDLHFGRSQKCKQCVELAQSLIDKSTLGDTLISNHFRSAQWAKVRGRARSLYKTEIEAGCENCEYKKHTEVCHIIPIPDFPLNTEVWRVNHRNNILILCSNCHWEADHNALDESSLVLEKLNSTRLRGLTGVSQWTR